MSWSNGYIYRRTITVDYTKVPNTDQTDFPVYLYLSSPEIKSTTNGGRVTSSSGYDIIFTSDSAGSTALYWEVESYDATNGVLHAHVKMTLSHTANTVFYMFYGNPSVSTFQSTVTSVWDSSFKCVMHLDETATGTIGDHKDSTGQNNGQNTVNQPTVDVYSKIKNGQYFVGNSSTYITLGLWNGSLNLTGNAITISCWIKPATLSSSSGQGWVVCKMGSSAGSWGLFYGTVSGTPTQYRRVCFGADLGAGWGDKIYGTNNTTITVGVWTHIAVTYNGSKIYTYINGQPDNNANASGSFASKGYAAIIGWENGWNSQYLNGTVDELKISSSARSADWLATEYNNQSSPGTFYTISAEEQNVSSTGGFGPLLLEKETGAAARGGSGNCAKLTPKSTTTTSYWKFYVPTGTRYTTETFTADGTFTPSQSMTVEYLIVGGGGGGGKDYGGGGGAGGVLNGTMSVTGSTPYSITVGTGGAGGTSGSGAGTSGGNSTAFGLTALGGGGGGSGIGGATSSGASGGGGSPNGSSLSPGSGSSGGHAGGSGANGGGQSLLAGGGGGAIEIGSAGTQYTHSGDGGDGYVFNISGVDVAYGGGGGGGGYQPFSVTAGVGGIGGGGNGGYADGSAGSNATPNTGGGGGGGAGNSGNGGSGANGIVIIRYQTTDLSFSLSFYHKISSGFNGSMKVTIYDTDQTSVLLNSETVTLVDDGYYHRYLSTLVTPSATGLCLVRIETLQGAHSSTDAIYIDDVVIV